MALSQSTLQTELRKLMDPSFGSFIGFPVSAAAAAANWATAYDNYASHAVDGSGSAIATKNKAGFQAALTFTGGASNGNALATQFANAWTAYWTGATFAVGAPFATSGNVGGNGIFLSETTSLVTVVNSASLLAALQTEFANKTLDGNAKATALASIFHTATTGSGLTVVITGLDTTPSPAGPLPITHTSPPA